jgi:hypothetical protein
MSDSTPPRQAPIPWGQGFQPEERNPVATVLRRSRRFAALLAASFAALGLAASAASAGPLVASATDCDAQSAEQPFLPWADPASYVLAPGGTIESGTNSWSVAGGADAVSGNEPYYVHGAGESSALRMPNGSSATTGSMCVGIEHPTLRFFAKNGGSSLSTLRVDVLFEDAFGTVRSANIGVVAGGANWQLTPQMIIVVNLLPVLPGDHTPVAFRFTPQGGPWTIDDVYVDPWQKP